MTTKHQDPSKNDELSAEEMVVICQKWLGFSEKDSTKLVKYLKRWEEMPLAPFKDRPSKLSVRKVMDIIVLTALTFKVLACFAIGLIKNKKEKWEDKKGEKNENKKTNSFF